MTVVFDIAHLIVALGFIFLAVVFFFPLMARLLGWIVLIYYVGQDISIWCIRRYYKWKNSGLPPSS